MNWNDCSTRNALHDDVLSSCAHNETMAMALTNTYIVMWTYRMIMMSYGYEIAQKNCHYDHFQQIYVNDM